MPASLHSTAPSMTAARRPSHAQQPAPAGQPRHHGADRHADDFGDFAVAATLNFAQDDDLAKLRRQQSDEVGEQVAALGLMGRRFGIGSGRGDRRSRFGGGAVIDVVERQVLKAPLLGEPAKTAGPDDGEPPGARVAAGEVSA